MSVNVVVLSGRLGKRPEIKATQSGKSVVSVGLCVDEGFGERRKGVFWQIEAWEKNAEALSKFGDKGFRLTVTGRLATDEYEKDGAKVVHTKIIASQIDFIDFPAKPEEEGF